ncbi:hypothetical protein T492DRAFT_856656, partial [Pavlovales sp. CCMP2436]
FTLALNALEQHHPPRVVEAAEACELTLAFNAAGELKVAASVTALPRSEKLAPSAKRPKHGGIKADRKLWLRYDRATNCMHCDACIRFNTTHPLLNFITGCNSIRLDRVRERERAGETNGHGDALFKLINSTKLGEDFSALLTKQISLEARSAALADHR